MPSLTFPLVQDSHFGTSGTTWDGANGGDGHGTATFPPSGGVDAKTIDLHFTVDVDTSTLPAAAVDQALLHVTALASGPGAVGVAVFPFNGAPDGTPLTTFFGYGPLYPGYVQGVITLTPSLTLADGHISAATLVISDLYLEIPYHLVITALDQASGGTLGGDPITITGGPFDGTETVEFGGVAATAITLVDPNTITCVTPAHATGTVDVVVTGPAGSATFPGFDYYFVSSAPSIALAAATPTGPAPSRIALTSTVTRGYNNGTLSYAWQQVSGPVPVEILSDAEADTDLVFDTFVEGAYVFELAVTTEATSGNTGITATAQIAVALATVPPRVTGGSLQAA